jgi:hypothetical protein
MTVRDYMNRVKAMQTSVKGYVDDIALQKEDLIINLNVTKMQSGLGTNDTSLKYANGYGGVYKERTVKIARGSSPPPLLKKEVSRLYNFGWSGDFLANFQIRIVGENKLEVYSTGTGTGNKQILLTKTQHMYGLNAEDTRKLNYEIIYPELMKFIKQFI